MDENLRAIISDEEEEQNYGVQTAQDLESELSEFRNKWKKELEKQHNLPDAKSSESKEEIIKNNWRDIINKKFTPLEQPPIELNNIVFEQIF